MYRREFGFTSAATLFTQLFCPVKAQSQILASGEKEASADVGLAGPAYGPWRRLFLDATVVEEQQGLVRKFHSAEKHPGNPIIVEDRPWEGKSAITGPYVYGTVLEDGQRCTKFCFKAIMLDMPNRLTLFIGRSRLSILFNTTVNPPTWSYRNSM